MLLSLPRLCNKGESLPDAVVWLGSRGGGPARGAGRKGGAGYFWCEVRLAQRFPQPGGGVPNPEQAPLDVWGTPVEEPPGGVVYHPQLRPTLPALWTRLQSWEETRSLIPEKGPLEDDTDVVVKGEDPSHALWRTPNPNCPGDNVFC